MECRYDKICKHVDRDCTSEHYVTVLKCIHRDKIVLGINMDKICPMIGDKCIEDRCIFYEIIGTTLIKTTYSDAVDVQPTYGCSLRRKEK